LALLLLNIVVIDIVVIEHCCY